MIIFPFLFRSDYLCNDKDIFHILLVLSICYLLTQGNILCRLWCIVLGGMM